MKIERLWLQMKIGDQVFSRTTPISNFKLKIVTLLLLVKYYRIPVYARKRKHHSTT